MTKTCGRCGVEQPLDNFGLHKRDGRQSWCRNCKREKAKEYYDRDPEKYRERTRARPESAKSAASSRYRSKNRDAVRAKISEYFKSQPSDWHKRRYLLEKARTGCACNHVNNRIIRGEMSRMPCEVCGTTVEVQGHHDDYNKPFEVRWLCVTHHAAWHQRDEPRWLDGWEERYRAALVEHGLNEPADTR